MGISLAALLLMSFVYPKPWSGWVFNHIVGGATGQTVRTVTSAEQVKSVGQPGVELHSDSGVQPKAAPPPAPQGTELRASLASGTTIRVAPESNAAGPATPPEVRIVPAAPAADAATRKQTGVPAVPGQRSQVTVGYGDTLEKIAIRYFGSKDGIQELVDANPQLTNIDQLSVGQIIHLPPGITSKTAHDQTATAPPVPNAEDSPGR
jgi:phage tail protein X